MIILISYDLKQPNRDYTQLYEAIKFAGSSWWHHLESVWIINTEMPIDQLSSLVRSYLDENDNLFVVDITERKHEGWLPSKAWEWFNVNK